MTIVEIGMVAADTTRTNHYLVQLIKNDLLPAYVLIMINSDLKLLPGQKDSSSKSKVIKLLDKKKIQYDIAPNNDINSHEVISLISRRKEQTFIFSGFGGVILRKDILNTGKKFLHVHGGYLPDYKGSTTNYYSLIQENKMGASSIFLTKDIDCGPVILRRKFQTPKDRKEIDHIYDSEVRSKVLIETIRNYVKNQSWDFELENNLGGETYYIIHPVLKHLAILGKE
ncbi:MAG: hypothetical protein HOL23_06230 [Gammaproteobacteria bacterium]|jgi:methionyl-tRNA formyltransferase|nr:hypothetical protein [Gammaproteobacteria bacterium]